MVYGIGYPRWIAKLVQVTPITIWFMDVYGIYNELVPRACKPTNITGGPYIVGYIGHSTQQPT